MKKHLLSQNLINDSLKLHFIDCALENYEKFKSTILKTFGDQWPHLGNPGLDCINVIFVVIIVYRKVQNLSNYLLSYRWLIQDFIMEKVRSFLIS